MNPPLQPGQPRPTTSPPRPPISRWHALLDLVRPHAPPLRRRAFWATQALIIAIAAGHAALEMQIAGRVLESLEFVPVSLFLVPVIYAALNFGMRGSLPTALWCALLTLPNAALWHSGIARLGELWQAGVIVAVGVFVGYWIDREKRARAEGEQREHARRTSEEQYRRLFETTADAILVLDESGTIRQANEAAAALFGSPAPELSGLNVERVAGARLANMIRSGQPGTAAQLPDRAGLPGRWVAPACSSFRMADGATQTQVLLRDVTAQQERQEGLEAYARHTLATREEERRRIARELHDGPVQSLVLLWRRLDSIEANIEPAHRRELALARTQAEQVAADLRRFSRELRPSLLDDLGLGSALKAEVAVVAERAGLTGRYIETGSSRRLEPDVDLSLLRIAQEAMHNVEHHAEATRFVVRLAYSAAAVRLSIADDGRGMKREPPALDLVARGKLGIVGMRERARLARGEMKIASRAGRGTTISVQVPATT